MSTALLLHHLSAGIQIKAQHACKEKSIYIETILFYN